MKLKIIIFAVIFILLLVVVIALSAIVVDNYQQQQKRVEALNKSIVETRQQLKTTRSQVYEQDTWLAEIQADIWSLQKQDEAFAYGRR